MKQVRFSAGWSPSEAAIGVGFEWDADGWDSHPSIDPPTIL